MIKKLFFLLLFPAFVFAQKEGLQRIDSLLSVLPKMKEDSLKVKTLSELSNAYQYTNPKGGIVYGQHSLQLAKKLKWNNGIAIAYKNIGVNYFMDSDFPMALSNYNKALTASESKKITADIISNISLIYSYQSNYAKALEYAFKALKIRESLHDTKSIANSLINIGNIYYDLDKENTAIYYSEKAVVYIEKLNDKRGLTRILYNLGLMYFKSGKNEKALAYFERGISISRKLGDNMATANYLSSIGNIYVSRKEYATALQYVKESIALCKDLPTGISNTAACYGTMGTIYLEQAKEQNNNRELLEKVKSNFTQALEIHKNLEDLEGISYDYTQLSDIQEMQGDYQSAYKNYRMAVVYKDSVFNADTKETIKNIEDQRTIELSNKEVKISKLKLESKEKQKWYFIFGLGLLAIIAGLLFFQNSNRRKTNRKLNVMNSDLDKANKVKTRLLSIINHDLRSPVNSFIHYIQLQKENPELLDKETKSRIENTTLSSAKNLLHSMEDILLWTKNQMENFEPQPKNIRIDSLFEDTKNYFSAVENVRFSFESGNNSEVFTDDNYLKTIMRNLTANAINALKDSAEPTIIWKAWSENNSTFLSISDNGPGINDEQLRALYDDKEVTGIQSGLGLHLVRDLAKAIHCIITVDYTINQGTTFTLQFA